MQRITNYLYTALFLFSYILFGQNQPGKTTYEIKKSISQIVVDGQLTESDWLAANRGGGFVQTFPTDQNPAQDSTQFMITYSNEYIYVGIICYDYLPGKPITNTLKRDFSWIRNDNVSFYIDPYNDRSNGFTFQVTPDNVQREGLVTLGGDVQDDWDNKWYSAVSHNDSNWMVEMAIPLKSIRYNAISEWNIQVIRNNQKRNERSVWIQVPQQMRASDMVYSGKLYWDELPPEAGPNVSVIPYISAGLGRDFEENEPTKQSADAGFDAKIGLSNSLNLDLTFNPDFSQVEVDEQVTNLQRFEISFPEKRQFFLENQDLFSDNGFDSSRPFFSRRIGIQGSGSSQRNVPIIGGARLSGKIGSKWRLGILDMVTNEDGTTENIAPAQNYAVAVLERQVFKRSRLSATFVSRYNLGQSYEAYDEEVLGNSGILQDLNGNRMNPKDTLYTLSDYNYVYGIDYNLATVENKWEGSFYYHRSIDPEYQTDNFSQGSFIRFQTPEVNWRAFYVIIGEGYNAEMGYVPRTGVTRYGTRIDYNFYTRGSIQRHGPSLGINGVVDRKWNDLDRGFSGEYEFQLLNSAELGIGFEWQSINLQDSFDPSGSDGVELNEGVEHSFLNGGVSFSSNNRKTFFYEIFSGGGQYYNGRLWTTGGSINFRYQPILQIGVRFDYNNINLPDPYSDAELFLISPRLDLTWTNNLFFTSFLQYNTQDNNFSQNHRFQWRFKPVSDLFIVYTDNYLTTPNFKIRNRALVLKMTYWLNL